MFLAPEGGREREEREVQDMQRVCAVAMMQSFPWHVVLDAEGDGPRLAFMGIGSCF